MTTPTLPIIRCTAYLALTLALAGCATYETPHLTPADWGPAPSAASYEPAIKTYFEDLLKDPDSARFRFGPPLRAYQQYGALSGQAGKVKWVGYILQVNVNAKNSFGGYTGYKRYDVLLNNTGSVHAITPGPAPGVNFYIGPDDATPQSSTPEQRAADL